MGTRRPPGRRLNPHDWHIGISRMAIRGPNAWRSGGASFFACGLIPHQRREALARPIGAVRLKSADPQLALETIATGTKQACAHSLGYENALEPCQAFVGKGLEDLHQLAVAAVQDQFPDCRCDFFRGQHLGLVDVHATHDGPCA